MRIRILLTVFIGLLLLIPWSAYTQPDQTTSYTFTKIGDGTFLDEPGDVSQAFLDLDSLTVQLTADTIKVSLGLAHIPDRLIFNQEALEIKTLNYEWSVTFDIDNSRSITDGDLFLSISHFKFRKELRASDILGITQKNLWIFEKGGNNAVNIGDLSHTHIKNNTILISVSKDLHASLEKIDESTNIHFRSIYKDGRQHYRDIYPNRE